MSYVALSSIGFEKRGVVVHIGHLFVVQWNLTSGKLNNIDSMKF